MLFFSNDVQKIQIFGFNTTETLADADVAVFFGRDSLAGAKGAASQGKTCFFIAAESELSFFEVACLAYTGIIVLRSAAAVKAVVNYLGENQSVDASKDEEADHEEQPDLVATLFESTREETPIHSHSGEPEQESGETGENENYLSEIEMVEEPPEPPKPNVPDMEKHQASKPDEKKELSLPNRTVAAPKRLATPDRFIVMKVFKNIYASYSPSTSVGKTFIAVNLAVWLAKQGVKVVLADLDPDKADLWHTSYMDAYGPPIVTVSNWSDVVGDPVQHVSQHPNLPNLFILPGTTVVGGPLPDDGVVEEILRTLAGRFDVVVADLNSLLRLTHIVAALRMAGKIFLLSDLSEKCVSQTSMIFSQASGIAGRDRMAMVVNRVQRGQLYRSRDMAKMFGFAEHSEIPDDPKTVMSCLKSRHFPVDTASPVGTALEKCFRKELAEFAEGTGEPKPSRWKGLPRLRRGVK